MNMPMVYRLIAKDWSFHRWTITAYVAGGALGLALVARGGEGPFYAGSTLLITALIAAGIHLVMATVVDERKEHTLAFVMSLPISSREYTAAKVAANLLIFFVGWAALTAGTVAVVLGREPLPDGLLPFALILLTQLLVGYCFILGVALVSESIGWTVGAVVAANLGFQFVLYWVSHLPAIGAWMEGDVPVWNRTALAVLAAEVALILAIVGLTFYLQGRKKDFL